MFHNHVKILLKEFILLHEQLIYQQYIVYANKSTAWKTTWESPQFNEKAFHLCNDQGFNVAFCRDNFENINPVYANGKKIKTVVKHIICR